MGFVVEDHDVAMGGDAIAQGCSGVERFGFGNGWSHPGIAFVFGFLFAFFVEAMNVGEVEGATCGCAAGFVLQDNGEVPVAAPFGGNQGIGVKNAPVAKVVFEAFVDGEVGGNDHKVPRHFGLGFAQGVEVAPDDAQAHDFGFACARCELEGITAPSIFSFGNA